MAKQLNKFRPKDKVLIISTEYKWGVVKDVAINRDKSGFDYTISFDNGFKDRKIAEEGLMKWMPKWKYNLKSYLSFIVW